MSNRKTCTVDEFAHILGIGRGTAYAAVRRGEIPHIRVGRRIVIPCQVVENLLAGRYNLPKPGREGQEVI
ncbi:MAG: helix-turn-helix domain-containing protein [Firmicutes bacterium]|nr:helix-turn-helix domain-containing protein [Bacillota bacterium]